jgi:maltose alpha-D-glucosyltransferase/alpha-amylase
MIGAYLHDARLLGRRTAEMHRALCDSSDPAFAPEPHTIFAQHAAEQRARRLAESTLALLRDRLEQLPDRARKLALQVECGEREMLREFHSALTGPEQLCRIRIHGDYHLGQVLYTGSDFVIIDFEGEPARPIEERRIKLSPLQDVAGMLRSFHYAAHAALRAFHRAHPEDVRDGATPADWAEAWSTWVGHEFLLQYLEISRGACYLPTNWSELDKLLRMHLLEKAVYELNYELNNRPDWVEIPLVGITKLLAS